MSEPEESEMSEIQDRTGGPLPGRVALVAAIIGVGNLYRGDDRIGILAARRAREILGDRVSLHDNIRDTPDLINAWEGVDAAILIDAAYTGREPGTVYELQIGDEGLSEKVLRTSTHSLSVSEAIELSRVLGTIPPVLIVFAIEGSVFEMGAEMSPPVEQALERVVSRVVERFHGLARAGETH